jgi:hypothetical protein
VSKVLTYAVEPITYLGARGNDNDTIVATRVGTASGPESA